MPDALNRLTHITDPLGGVTQFTYDGNGNLLTVTDARGNIITHTYNSMDRLATRTDPVGAVESFQYDPLGNLTQHTDRKSHVNTFSYDALNRRLGAGYADGATTSFIYDAIGRLIQATDSVGGTIVNQYDILDRLVAQITALGTVGYEYDALGRRTTMEVTGQASVTYNYDANSRLTQVVQGTQVVDLAHDALGRRTQQTLPNGVSTEYQYDAASRLTELIYRNTTNILGNLTYGYDTAGNRTRVGGSFARTLLPDPVPSAIYDAANRQLTFGDKTMTFDANGNLTSITDPSGTTTFGWDARNRLLVLSSPATTTNFTYDAFGRRVKKTINGQPIEYLYDRFNPLQELSGGNQVTTLLTGPDIDEYFARTNSDGTKFFLVDTLGSILALTDPTTAVQTEYTYEPFGRTNVSGVASSNPYQYTGRENEGTGLYYYRARYYHPQLQRFISEDPVELYAGDFNLYAYVRNNPTNLIDPEGMLAVWHHGMITYQIARDMGLSRWESLEYGYYAMRPDLPFVTKTPVGHAEAGQLPGGGGPQTPQEALQATGTFVRESFESSSKLEQGEGFHATQDVFRHRGERWPPIGDTYIERIWERLQHYWRDAFPSPDEINEAYGRTFEGFRQILGRRK